MADQPISIPISLREGRRGRSIRRPAAPRVSWQLLPLILIVVIVIFAPYVTASPTAQSLSNRLEPPFGFGGRWLGTDGLGRDLLARIITGARNSLTISLIAASGAAVIGIAAGIIAGMVGGLVDRIITLLVESVLAVPFITVGLMVTATIGQSATALVLLLVGTGWITHARVLRSQARLISASEFVLSSESIGGSRMHIMLRHILPNLLPVAIVVYFQQIGSMLLWSASLTWLGIGLPIERISLGGIVRDGQELLYNGPWVSIIGGLTIILIVTSLNLAADWLRRAMDPRMRGFGDS